MSNNEAFKRKFTYVYMTVRFMIILGYSLQSIFKNDYCKIEQGRPNFTLWTKKNYHRKLSTKTKWKNELKSFRLAPGLRLVA